MFVGSTRDIVRKIRLEISLQTPIDSNLVQDLFSNINDVLVLGEHSENKNMYLQFRILEIKEMLRFLSSLPFDTDKTQKLLQKHLSLCLNYHSTESDTPVQESLASLHLRVLQLPSISPDYFGFAMGKIIETLPVAHLTQKEKQNFDQILPQLLHPPLLLLDDTLPHDLRYQNISSVKDKAQLLLETCTTSPSGKLNSLLPYLQSILLSYEDILEVLGKNPSASIEVKAQLSGVGLGFFEIDMDVALRLLSLTATGQSTKGLGGGTHAVCHCKGVFYKLNFSRAPIAPEKEFAIYSLYNLLQVDAITPVALTKIRNVILDGQNLGKTLSKMYTVQASNGVDGILLQDVMNMAEIPAILRKSLGNQKANSLFELLLNHPPDVESFIKHTDMKSLEYFEKMELEEKAQVIMSLYVKEFRKLPEKERCIGFEDLSPLEEQKIRGDFCVNMVVANTYRFLLEALWVIKHYPEICMGRYFFEITDICKFILKIKELFPKLNAKDTMLELDSMLNKFDEENFSAHFLVTMLTNASDHKADNLMILFDWNDDGTIQKLRIIGIDNDIAFDQEKRINTCVYLLQNMNHSFHHSIRQRLIQSTPEGFILDWLIALEEQNNRYKNFIAQKILTEDDFHKQHLAIPLQLDSTIVTTIYKKLKKLLHILEGSGDVSHWNILSQIQSGVSKAYKIATNFSQQPKQAFNKISEGFAGYESKELLSGITESPAEAASAFLSSVINISSFDEVMQVHLIGKVLRFFPGQGKTIQIPGEARDVRSRRKFFLLAVEYGYCALIATLLEEERIVALQENRFSKENQFSLLEQKDGDGKTPFLIACSHANTDMLKMLLHYGCNTLASDKDQKSCVILLISCLPQHPMNASAALRLLGDYEDIPWNSGCREHMTNPLHVLVNLYSQIPDIVMPFLAFLMSKGASPDLVDGKGLSPLDYAMQQNLVEVVQVLIDHGAGRVFHLSIANNFFCRNSMNGLYNELIHYSLLLRWNLALQCLQAHSANSGVCLEGTNLKKVFLPPDLVSELFHKGEIRGTGEFGSRNVHNIEIKDENRSYRLYFKQDPELPGIEYAVEQLFELLIGHGTSYSDLVKATISPGKSFPILISQAIPGENLATVLKDKPQLLEKLNDQHFSELLLASLLVNFEDAKPDNFILEELPDGSFRIVGIDNDHAFIPPISMKDGKTLLVKCILYCLDKMSSPIHPKAREKFLSLDPERILELWLNRLADKQMKYFDLFPSAIPKKKGSLLSRKKVGSTVVAIPFQKRAITEIYQKFKRIQNCLRSSNEVTGMLLLRAVIPELGIRYEQAFIEKPTPLQRFDYLTHGLYKIAKGRRETRVNSRQILESMEIELKEYDEARMGPHVAMKELQTLKKEIYADNNRRKQIQQELGKGKVNSFQNLELDIEKEKIINGVANEFPSFNFSLFDDCVSEIKQKGILVETVLCGGNYRSLHIHHCSFQKDLLAKIMLSSKQLVSLELFKCQGLDAKMIQTLANSPCLNSLQLIELRDIGEKLSIPFRLRTLEISNCQGIVTLRIPNTLKQLVLNHCRTLEVITAHFIVGRKLKRKDKEFQIEKLTMKACIKHDLWTIFSSYLKEDLAHFLYLKNISVTSFNFAHLFDVLLFDMKDYPKAIMAQDLCRNYEIPFLEFFTKIFERCQNLQCVGDYATAFTFAMKASSSPRLIVNNKQLTGEIPLAISQLANLVELDLSKNQLIGHIPDVFSELSCLTELDLSDNQLTGPIPPTFSKLSNLCFLFLNNNQLTGHIPPELGQLSKLLHLNLDNNQLTGEIPHEFTQLTKLRYLFLNNNQLDGDIHKMDSFMMNTRDNSKRIRIGQQPDDCKPMSSEGIQVQISPTGLREVKLPLKDEGNFVTFSQLPFFDYKSPENENQYAEKYGFNSNAALWSVNCCHLLYKSEEVIETVVKHVWDMHAFKFFYDNHSGAKCFCMHNGEVLVICFGGKIRSEQYLKSLTKSYSKNPAVETTLELIFPPMEQLIDKWYKLYPDLELFVCGHSTGGGTFATLCFSHFTLSDNPRKVHSVYTFGAPPVGTKICSELLETENSCNSKFFRISNNQDSVPNLRVPGGEHYGIHVNFDAEGTLTFDSVQKHSSVFEMSLQGSTINYYRNLIEGIVS